MFVCLFVLTTRRVGRRLGKRRSGEVGGWLEGGWRWGFGVVVGEGNLGVQLPGKSCSHGSKSMMNETVIVYMF